MVRHGVRARYLKYEMDVKDVSGNGVFHGQGPAFGIQDANNLFYIQYHWSSTLYDVCQVTDGKMPIIRTNASGPSLSANNVATLIVEVYESSGNDVVDVSVKVDGGSSTTVISGYNISQHGYSGGYVGAASWYSGERRLDNAKLWIDEDAPGGVVDDPADLVDQVFSDDFGSTDNEISPTYDANGNLTFDGVYKYTYDAWNRLVQVRAGEEDESVFATYRYDGTGRRIVKTVTASADFDRTEYYYYDGHRVIETRNASEVAVMQVVFGTQYIDEPIRLDVDTNGDGDCLDSGGSTFYYYHQDANYNVIALTDSSGDLVHRYLYDAYGTPHTYTVNSNGVSTAEVLLPGLDADGDGDVDVYSPYLFTGREYDPETRLYHYRARAYHPQLGRFMQRDPLGIWRDHGNAGNGYAYVGSNSLGRLDPYGFQGVLFPWPPPPAPTPPPGPTPPPASGPSPGSAPAPGGQECDKDGSPLEQAGLAIGSIGVAIPIPANPVVDLVWPGIWAGAKKVGGCLLGVGGFVGSCLALPFVIRGDEPIDAFPWARSEPRVVPMAPPRDPDGDCYCMCNTATSHANPIGRMKTDTCKAIPFTDFGEYMGYERCYCK